ncbi:MAG: ABC transporter ATP-binding protein [Chloroflexi bacterium]|nr:ABC transporter ATP-binding protein [Chloroflexota bacterium]
MDIQVEHASWSADAKTIVDTVDLRAKTGEFIGLIGPNGSGKSTLLRLMYRFYLPDSGIVLLDERDIWSMAAKEVARCTAVVAQERASDFDFSVDEIVMMGRTPHKGMFDPDTFEDDTIVEDALRRVGMSAFSRRNFHTLSGGEKQRVLVARALAQQARVLILDEPTNHLDIRYQIEILELVRSLRVTTVAALHDLNLAARYCDRLYLLDAGKVVAEGPPASVLTPSTIADVYGVVAEVGQRHNGRLHIVFDNLINN